MKLSNNIKQKQDKKGGLASFLRFLVRHVEKIAAGLIVIAAIGLALQTRNYQPLSWQPDDLDKLVDNTEKTIKESKRTITDEGIRIFDYAAYAEQIREQIPSEPYQHAAAWFPVLHPARQPRGGFDVLIAESLRGEAVRRIGLNTQGKAPVRWQRPPLPEGQLPEKEASIWINLYGTIPLKQQRDIYHQVFGHVTESNSPEYIYYELEKAEIKPNEELAWQPVIVYPDYPDSPNDNISTNQDIDSAPDFTLDFSPDRLIPFGPLQGKLQEEELFLFSDSDILPAKTYVYRIRLYLANPNYKLQESSVAEGVDTKNQFIRSDWSAYTWVYVPDRTQVQLQSVTPTDTADFPRQAAPLRAMRGTLLLDYFDIELGQLLKPVEKTNVLRGMVGNISKDEANKYINKGRPPEEVVNINYPDSGLRSDVCIMDFSGGRKLQRRPSSPDLSVPGKALLLMPDGTMQVITTESELFR